MVCPRCAKKQPGIHTCTPTDGWRKLEARIAELEQINQALMDTIESRLEFEAEQRDTPPDIAQVIADHIHEIE